MVKVEAQCPSLQCPSYGCRQLVDVAKVRLPAAALPGERRDNPSRGMPIDSEGNIAECDWCGTPLNSLKSAPDDALLPLGAVVFTPGVVKLFEMDIDERTSDKMNTFQSWTGKWLRKHQRGDWGSLPIEDAPANRSALRIVGGRPTGRVMSVWFFNREKVWIITELDRSHTTVLLPEEY